VCESGRVQAEAKFESEMTKETFSRGEVAAVVARLQHAAAELVARTLSSILKRRARCTSEPRQFLWFAR
jgi:hypothetical protein